MKSGKKVIAIFKDQEKLDDVRRRYLFMVDREMEYIVDMTYLIDLINGDQEL